MVEDTRTTLIHLCVSLGSWFNPPLTSGRWLYSWQQLGSSKVDPSCIFCVAISSRRAPLRAAQMTPNRPFCLYDSFISTSKRSFHQTPWIHTINYLSSDVTWCCCPTDHNFSSLWEDSERLLNIQYPSACVGLIEWLAEVICFRNLINPFWPSKQ